MLDATARLLQSRGFHGTALNDILAESGAPRGSLYFHFPGGKSQLVLEATTAAVDATTRQREEVVNRTATPGEVIRAISDGVVQVLLASDFERGCPVSPLVLDASGREPEFRELCRNAIAGWIGLLQRALKGFGFPERRANALAILSQSSLQGAALIARAYQSVEPIREAADVLGQLLDDEHSKLKRPPRKRTR